MASKYFVNLKRDACKAWFNQCHEEARRQRLRQSRFIVLPCEQRSTQRGSQPPFCFASSNYYGATKRTVEKEKGKRAQASYFEKKHKGWARQPAPTCSRRLVPSSDVRTLCVALRSSPPPSPPPAGFACIRVVNCWHRKYQLLDIRTRGARCSGQS